MVLQGVDNFHEAQPLQDFRLHRVVSEVVQQRLQISFQGLIPTHRQGATSELCMAVFLHLFLAIWNRGVWENGSLAALVICCCLTTDS